MNSKESRILIIDDEPDICDQLSGLLNDIGYVCDKATTSEKGIEILNGSNSFNHVQALVINNKKIISYEKRKGTKDMLKSIRNNNLKHKLLIKMPKSKQDLRVDLPTFGLDTIKDCKKANIKGIVVKAGQNIFLDKQKGLQFANKNNIFVMAK